MFVVICITVIACSCGQDVLNWAVARQLARQYHKRWDVALAVVKGISVAELHRRWAETAICVLLAVVVTLLLVSW
jgi:hypothetical protein